MKVTAAIVVYRPRRDWLMRSIRSFLDKDNFDKKLFVIDNSPNKNTDLALLSNRQIEYTFTNRNLGFGKAHNLGIKKAVAEKSDFHLILNPDVSFDSDIITELCLALLNDKSIGLISPKVVYETGETQKLCKLLPTPKQLFFRRFLGKSPRLKKLNQELELHSFGYNYMADIPWLSGCFLLGHTNYLAKLGGFDEQFFMYMEDVDLSRRSLDHCRNVFYPKVTITHLYEKGSYKSLGLTLAHAISAIKYFNKWGWFIDAKRDEINSEALRRLHPI